MYHQITNKKAHDILQQSVEYYDSYDGIAIYRHLEKGLDGVILPHNGSKYALEKTIHMSSKTILDLIEELKMMEFSESVVVVVARRVKSRHFDLIKKSRGLGQSILGIIDFEHSVPGYHIELMLNVFKEVKNFREFITIPAGQVTLLGNEGYLDIESTFDVSVFEIAKYPVTNMEYRNFVEDGGYDKKEYWVDAGWNVKENRNWYQPRYWNDTDFNQDNHPVVGISWYEAIAYCNWLSEKTGNNITLPTEQQWQRAAQAMPDGSDSGHLYPWGNEWDANKCNNQNNTTTPVDHYEQAGNVSPCGAVDMTGNVWEWCLTKYETGKQDVNGDVVRVLRGGSWWYSDSGICRANFRNWGAPADWFNFWGFRCVRL